MAGKQLETWEESEFLELWSRCVDELKPANMRIGTFDDFGILNALPVPFAVAHGITGRLIFVNHAYAVGLGYAADELIFEKRWFDLAVDVSIEDLKTQIALYERFGACDEPCNRRWRHKEGHIVTGTARYFAASTQEIRSGQKPEKSSNSIQVVCAMIEFDHMKQSEGLLKVVEASKGQIRNRPWPIE